MGEAPAVGRLDDDVVIVAAVEPLGDLGVARERGDELAAYVDPAGRVGGLVDDDVGDVVGGRVLPLAGTEPLDDRVASLALDAPRPPEVVDGRVGREQFGEARPSRGRRSPSRSERSVDGCG